MWLRMVKVRGETREFGGGLWRLRLLGKSSEVPNVAGGAILAGGRVAIADVAVDCRSDSDVRCRGLLQRQRSICVA